jgi:alkanesulfonate monooxygenase SsuD/methylene tetrahydromethanopterin reductase-like flavin-dependent oxidoreductase (luciferase family)
VTTVDEMSGGRVELGMGAGWNEPEHRQLGIPYPELGERYGRLEEAVAIVHGLWTEPDGWTYQGRHWQVDGSVFSPRPASADRRHPNLILGGDGGPRLARLLATHADEFNRQSATPDRLREAYGRISEACVAAGRDPGTVVRSAMVGVLVAETQGELRDRVRQQTAMFGADADADDWLAERRERWIIGTPDEAHQAIATLEAAGAERIMLQDFLPRDLDMVALLGRIAAA